MGRFILPCPRFSRKAFFAPFAKRRKRAVSCAPTVARQGMVGPHGLSELKQSSAACLRPCSRERFAKGANRSRIQGWREIFFTKIVKKILLKDAPQKQKQGQNQNLGGSASALKPGTFGPRNHFKPLHSEAFGSSSLERLPAPPIKKGRRIHASPN
ncbi:MAG: hypothetical protein HQL97_12475 [Magnetococcales bacterium]|nr:hypothetical protein [Magnetococcales bacterium]